MLKLLTLLYLTGLKTVFVPQNNDSLLNKTFLLWNHVTLKSLEGQYAVAAKDRQKKDYDNRIFGFKALMELDDAKSVNKNSLRYLFLQQVLPRIKSKNVFIVEANMMASVHVLRNFLIYKADNDTSMVELYIYLREKGWYKKGSTRIHGLKFDTPLSQYLVSFGKGFTYEDVIISHFGTDNEITITSEYYLFTTLSAESDVKKLLDMYDQNAFDSH
ncbi:hypothetical protein [Chitinophaga barathri]|uniref:Uncharacterized protein n=1 Tax=Chitinophaga barathri TaxID=1647451 RepID=A0A3N4MFF3_9BACT|nr:hypothetical protein [Chitinophaga barathri]RPD42561.1 hypothetical protein EG028_05140 [Chitinophaga barathri]